MAFFKKKAKQSNTERFVDSLKKSREAALKKEANKQKAKERKEKFKRNLKVLATKSKAASVKAGKSIWKAADELTKTKTKPVKKKTKRRKTNVKYVYVEAQPRERVVYVQKPKPKRKKRVVKKKRTGVFMDFNI